MLDFPGRDEEEQRDGRVGRGAGTEHHVAGVVVALVTAGAEVAAAGTDVGDDGEGEEAESAHEEAVDEFVGYELLGEDTGFDVVWGAQHAVFLGLFETETDGEKGGRDEVGPEDLDGGEREDGVVVIVFEGEADEEEDDLGDVGDEEMHEEL